VISFGVRERIHWAVWPICHRPGQPRRQLGLGADFRHPGRGAGPDAATADPNMPDLFIAIQEQLGLKLEPTKGPVEVLVIDSIERPSED
jgi:uncharacterized protein (TIGR03435 family)